MTRSGISLACQFHPHPHPHHPNIQTIIDCRKRERKMISPMNGEKRRKKFLGRGRGASGRYDRPLATSPLSLLSWRCLGRQNEPNPTKRRISLFLSCAGRLPAVTGCVAQDKKKE